MLIPNFVSVPAQRYGELKALPEPVDAVLDLLNANALPALGVDRFWVGVQAGLADGPGASSVSGVEEWGEDPPVGAVDPEYTAALAQVLADADPAEVEAAGMPALEQLLGEETEGEIARAFGELSDFYAQAAERGDAVLIVFN